MAVMRVAADERSHENAPNPDRSRFVIHPPVEGSADGVDPVLAEAACDAEVISEGHVTRTIPPKTRREVLERDRYGCRVPGCTNQLWLDLHHVHHHAHGGSNRARNLVTVCGVHHRMAHQGLLDVRLEADGFAFVFADRARRTGFRATPVSASPPGRRPVAGGVT